MNLCSIRWMRKSNIHLRMIIRSQKWLHYEVVRFEYYGCYVTNKPKIEKHLSRIMVQMIGQRQYLIIRVYRDQLKSSYNRI